MLVANGRLRTRFLLDINQKSSQPFLSLDELRLYVGATGDLTGYSGNQLAGLNAVYDMGGSNGDGNWVKLDARLTHGSGSGDMLLYVPNSAFAGASGSYRICAGLRRRGNMRCSLRSHGGGASRAANGACRMRHGSGR